MSCAPRPRGSPAAASRWGRATIGHEELIGHLEKYPSWFYDRRWGSRRGRSFNPGPLIEAV